MFGLFSRKIVSSTLKRIEEKVSLIKITNNRSKEETLEAYTQRSLEQLMAQLKKNHFYAFVVRASLEGTILSPGHITSFLTNPSEPTITPESCMSLRSGTTIHGKEIQFILEHDTKKMVRRNKIYTVAFTGLEQEFSSHFLKHATPETSGEGYLFEVPITLLPEPPTSIVERIVAFKKQNENQEYILCDGNVISNQEWERFAKAFNCVTGFYAAVGVEGSETNPSPQMAILSYLSLLLGITKRNDLVDNTGFRRKGKRQHDDPLKKKLSTCTHPGLTYFDSPAYKNWSETDKTNAAILATNSYDETMKQDPDICYFAGMGYAELGSEYYEKALFHLKRAMENDRLKEAASKKISEIELALSQASIVRPS